MAMKITNDYINYELQSMAKGNAAGSTEKGTEQTAEESAGSRADAAHKSDWAVVYSSSFNKSQSLADYARELARLAPSVQVRAGNTFSSARSGKTLTLSYGILNKMRNDPETEKEMKEMIKGVEFITKFIDGLYKASGKTLVYRHSFIDKDGKYRCFSQVKDVRSQKMSVTLRKERQKNSQKLIKRSQEKALKNRKALQKKSQVSRKAGKGTKVDLKL